jgi:hypothetical protein
VYAVGSTVQQQYRSALWAIYFLDELSVQYHDLGADLCLHQQRSMSATSFPSAQSITTSTWTSGRTSPASRFH